MESGERDVCDVRQILQLMQTASGYHNPVELWKTAKGFCSLTRTSSRKLVALVSGPRKFIHHYARDEVNFTFFSELPSGSSLPLLYLGGSFSDKAEMSTCQVQVWFVHSYPQIAPTCEVIPKLNMRLKAGHPNVESSGRFNHPCISAWNQNC
jgi:hypothetical protein